MEKTVNISTSTLIRALLVVVGASLLVYLNSLVIMLLVAVVVASAIEPWILWLRKYKMGRGFAVTSIFLTIVLIVSSIFYFLLPPLLEDVVGFIKHIPEVLQKITVSGKTFGLSDLSLYFSSLADEITAEKLMEAIKSVITGGGSFFEVSSALVSSLVNIGLTFVMAFYLATEDNGVSKFLRIIFPVAHEKYVEDLWSRSQMKFAHWLRGQLTLSLVISILVLVPLLIIGLPYATLLAVLAFFGEFIPMVGLSIATVPALIVAFVNGGLSLFLIVLAIYGVINFLEGHVLYPTIMNRAVGVPSIIIVIAVLVGAELAGLWGVILSVPLSAVLMEFVADVSKKKEGERN